MLISLISLRRLLRQRGFISFRLLFLVTTQRVSRCSLPSLRGRGWGKGHFYVFYYLCHYDFCPLSHSGFCLLVTLSFTYSAPYVHYVILASVPLLLCLLHTLSLMSLSHYVFRSSVTMSFTYSAPYVFMSLWLLPPCYYVFYILSPLCLYVIMSSVPLLLCLLHTQSLMSLCHSGFCSLCTFWLHKCKVFLQTSYFVGNL